MLFIGLDSIGLRKWLCFGIDWLSWGPLGLMALSFIKCSFVYSPAPFPIETIETAVPATICSGLCGVVLCVLCGWLLMVGWIERSTTTRRSLLPALPRRKRRILWSPSPTSSKYIRADVVALAVMWFFTTPVFLALVPYFIYSVFHVLTYFSEYVLPAITAKPARPQEDKLAQLARKYQDTGSQTVAKVEVYGILIRLLAGILM